jgi:hypothetical protein
MVMNPQCCENSVVAIVREIAFFLRTLLPLMSVNLRERLIVGLIRIHPEFAILRTFYQLHDPPKPEW